MEILEASTPAGISSSSNTTLCGNPALFLNTIFSRGLTLNSLETKNQRRIISTEQDFKGQGITGENCACSGCRNSNSNVFEGGFDADPWDGRGCNLGYGAYFSRGCTGFEASEGRDGES
ncbi:hypothetical protein GQ457_07G027350 [Hibiscus cannabinus]